MKSNELDDILTFEAVEKDIYIDPPLLPQEIPEDLKLLVWKEWLKKDDIKRRAHKASITKKLKAAIPNHEVSTYKSGGVHRQKIGMIGLEGDAEDFNHIISIPATQDRHFQARGKRAGNSSKRNNRRKRKLQKTQLILNARRM